MLKNLEKSGERHFKQSSQFSGKLWLSSFIWVSIDGIFTHGNANLTDCLENNNCFLWRTDTTVMTATEG